MNRTIYQTGRLMILVEKVAISKGYNGRPNMLDWIDFNVEELEDHMILNIDPYHQRGKYLDIEFAKCWWGESKHEWDDKCVKCSSAYHELLKNDYCYRHRLKQAVLKEDILGFVLDTMDSVKLEGKYKQIYDSYRTTI